MGTGRAGKTVAANFPLFCDVAPPSAGPRVIIAGPESPDPRRGEEILLEAGMSASEVATLKTAGAIR